MNYEKYLPIGSVVLLKGGKQRIMITGYATIDVVKKDKVYDYCGCMYPIGIISTDQNLLFDHSQIEKVSALGYIDEEQKEFMSKLKANLTDDRIKEILKQSNQKEE